MIGKIIVWLWDALLFAIGVLVLIFGENEATSFIQGGFSIVASVLIGVMMWRM